MSDRDLAGVRLYAPAWLLVYFLVGGLALGLAAFGINVARRGHRGHGIALAAAGAVAFVAVLGTTDPTRYSTVAYGILSLFVGIGVLRGERAPYRQALAAGALPAPWWPPLVLGFLAMVLVVAAWEALLGPLG